MFVEFFIANGFWIKQIISTVLIEEAVFWNLSNCEKIFKFKQCSRDNSF